MKPNIEAIVKAEIEPVKKTVVGKAENHIEEEIKNEEKLVPKVEYHLDEIKMNVVKSKPLNIFSNLNITTHPIHKVENIFNHVKTFNKKEEHADVSVFKTMYGVDQKPVVINDDVMMIGEAYHHKTSKDMVNKQLNKSSSESQSSNPDEAIDNILNDILGNDTPPVSAVKDLSKSRRVIQPRQLGETNKKSQSLLASPSFASQIQVSSVKDLSSTLGSPKEVKKQLLPPSTKSKPKTKLLEAYNELETQIPTSKTQEPQTPPSTTEVSPEPAPAPEVKTQTEKELRAEIIAKEAEKIFNFYKKNVIDNETEEDTQKRKVRETFEFAKFKQIYGYERGLNSTNVKELLKMTFIPQNIKDKIKIELLKNDFRKLFDDVVVSKPTLTRSSKRVKDKND